MVEKNNRTLIENNNEINVGVVKLINEDKNGKITINKELLISINYFIACLGTPGSGKSTFASNYYKKLYNVKNDYFEISKSHKSFTEGIWMISDKERRKIPKYIFKDMLDVEGFKIQEKKSWKYINVIAFLATDLLILNNDRRLDDVGSILQIIENCLKEMKRMNIPIILQVIYIQIKDIENSPSKEELSQMFKIDMNIFIGIKFQYIKLPRIHKPSKELLKYSDYKKCFEDILDLLNKPNNCNAVTSLIKYIDSFNKVINDETYFNSQAIIKDIENNFYGLYNIKENELKGKLLKQSDNLKKLDNLNETFEDFINKQNLNFEFEIKNEELYYYGSSQDYDDIYENLRKNRSFKVDAKDLFLDFYNTEKKRLELQEKKRIEEEKKLKEEEEIKRKKQLKIIVDEFIRKKQEINNYFASLKFYQTIDKEMDLKLQIDTDQIDYKSEREKEIEEFFMEKVKKKEKEWEDQIQRAKWKTPVQAYGDMECVNGHKFSSDNIHCNLCKKGDLFWVDSDTRYVICRGCNKVFKLSEPLKCNICGADVKSKVNWIEGYKP